MLVIRAPQMEAFRADARRQFLAALRRHAERYFPAAAAVMTVEELDDVCEHAVERSAIYGITGEREICLWLNLMLAFGRDFDTDPSLPWTTLLRDPSQPGPRVLMSRLYRAAQSHATATKEPAP